MRHDAFFSSIIIGVIACIFTCTSLSYAQIPHSFKYQAVARDIAGDPIVNQLLTFRLSLHEGNAAGLVVYGETHTVTSNDFGLVNLEIGNGTILSGSFAGISWQTGAYYLEIELDPAGGTNYQSMGTAQFLSVPYALYSEKSGQSFTPGPGIDITDTTITNTAPNAMHTGDAIGSTDMTVVKIQGKPVSPDSPVENQVLQWLGTEWKPSTLVESHSEWLINGNSNTSAADNFIGTTNNNPLMFRINNISAGKIELINTSFGYKSLFSNTTGISNTAIGDEALSMNTSGFNNTANGRLSLASNVTGSNNTAFGAATLFNNTSGFSNVAYGSNALFNNTTGNNLIAIGDSALYFNGLGASSNSQGIHNTAIGSKSLYVNTIGSFNTAAGWESLHSNVTGNNNTAYGSNALSLNANGSSNTAIGSQAMAFSKTGNYNIAIGSAVLYSDTSGSSNTGVGISALYANRSGNYNTAIGSSSMFSNTIGSYNVALGNGALSACITGAKNTAIGDAANISSGSLTQTVALGNSALANASYKIRIGSTNVLTIEGQVAWSYPSDGRFKTNISEDVKGLEFINRLRPILYNFETRKYTEFLTKNMHDSLRANYISSNDFAPSMAVRQSGFVAQEVVQAAKAAGYNFNGVHVPVDENDNYSLSYSQFVVPLVKAVQEQQLQIENLKKENQELRQHIMEIRALIVK